MCLYPSPLVRCQADKQGGDRAQRALARRRAKVHLSSGPSVRSRPSRRHRRDACPRHVHLLSTLPPRPTLAVPSDCAGHPTSSTYRTPRDSRCGFRPHTSTPPPQRCRHQLESRVTSSLTPESSPPRLTSREGIVHSVLSRVGARRFILQVGLR